MSGTTAQAPFGTSRMSAIPELPPRGTIESTHLPLGVHLAEKFLLELLFAEDIDHLLRDRHGGGVVFRSPAGGNGVPHHDGADGKGVVPKGVWSHRATT